MYFGRIGLSNLTVLVETAFTEVYAGEESSGSKRNKANNNSNNEASETGARERFVIARNNSKTGLLLSVGKVVVATVHVAKSAGLADLEDTSIKVSTSVVEFRELSTKGAVIGSAGREIVDDGSRLIRVAGNVSGSVEHIRDCQMSRINMTRIKDFDDVVSVGLCLSLTVIVAGIGVGAGPLKMNKVGRR